MLSIPAADSLLHTWAWWSDSDTAPKPPGNHWHWVQAGYRQSTPSYDTETMLAVDAAVAALRRDYEREWLVLRAYYVQRRQRSERKLERALRAFCSVY